MKVGDYIRTKDGVIAKITDIIADYSIDCDRDVFDLDNIAMMEIPYYFKDEYIVKSSPNIIDLIEVGDYVNGERVIYKQYKEYPNPLLDHYIVDTTRRSYSESEIKSIVTKKQFESMEYRIGE